MKKTILSVFSFLLLLGNGYPVYASHNYLPDGNNPEVDNNLKKQKTIQGVVTDTNGEPIIGVTIIEKGTTNGTTSDIDGKFSLKALIPQHYYKIFFLST